MLLNVNITEKSFGNKSLMKDIRFAVSAGEKVGVIGRNGTGKSTLLRILSGQDEDYTGEIQFRRGSTVVATNQEYADAGERTVLQYILEGLPEYLKLSKIIHEYPATMGEDMKMIEEYTSALDRFVEKDFHYIEDKVREELKNFGMSGLGDRKFASLSGGQKRLTEVVKIMHADANLAVIDEPTNFMDYVAKEQFVEWMKAAPEAILIITHDRDVLEEVDKIIEIKDQMSVVYKGNY
ncbi:ATP-binding cassette domain-containing protein, partial [Candidatus Saccharibacteria bacterium]|nr:ATP-binding cassette domain-containing protein [Candidatus Saccharibacteria bacterium]